MHLAAFDRCLKESYAQEIFMYRGKSIFMFLLAVVHSESIAAPEPVVVSRAFHRQPDWQLERDSCKLQCLILANAKITLAAIAKARIATRESQRKHLTHRFALPPLSALLNAVDTLARFLCK